MMRCSVCGRENESTFRFCLDCGSEISAGVPAPPPAVQSSEPPPGASGSNAPLPIPLTEIAPPTGVMPMQSAATGPADSLPSVSSATPPGGLPAHTPIPPSALEPTAPSAPSNPATPAAPPAPAPALPPAPEAPTAASSLASPVPPVSAPAPGAAPSAPDHARPCPTCGVEVAAGHAFCGSCGARADALAPLPATAGSTAAAAATGGTMVMGSVDAPELAAPTFKITVIDPDGKEARTVPLTGPKTVAGDRGAAIPILDDPFVASSHLTLVENTGVLRVEDGGTETGTFLKISAGNPVPLLPGAALRFGRQRLRLQTLEPLADTAPAADGTQEWGSPDAGAPFRLVQELEGGGDGAAWLLTEGTYQIGREQGELAFPDDGYVSGRHGQLKVGADGQATYEDLGSSNGSFLRLTRSTVLSEGDFLLVGMHLLRIDLQ